jgi:hypothetical protein
MFYNLDVILNTPATILIPKTEKINGITKKTFDESYKIFVSFKTFGGTEKIVNDMVVVEDTATVVCWFNSNIATDCRLKLLDDNSEWDIISPPENIDRRSQYMKFKVRRLTGKS